MGTRTARPGLRGLAAVAVAALALTACAPSAPSASSSASGKANPDATVTIATTTDVVNYNPLVGNSHSDYWVTNLMYPHLLTIGNSGQKSASLATKWGYTTPTKGFYDIRSDMKWSDGVPLTAEDVAWTLNAVKQDKPAGTLYGQLVNFASAKAVSKTRVVLTLSRPDATVVNEIGFWGNIVPKHVFDKAKSVATFANNKNWVGAGPYTLTSAVKGQSYTLVRHTPYPFAPNNTPTAAKIIYKVYPDVNTEILALKKGDVDAIADPLPPTQVDSLKSASGITVQKVPGLGYTHMTYNMARKPLNNVLVRKALAQSVNYAAIKKVVLRGQAIGTGSSPIMPVLSNFYDSSLTQYPFDTAAARKLLQQAGYTAGSNGMFPLHFQMIYSLNNPIVSEWVSLVKSDAAKSGITIDLQGLARNTYLAKTNQGAYDIYAGDFAIMDDPATNMTLTYLPGGAINYTHVNDPALSSLITKAMVSTDMSTQKKLLQQAATIVHNKVYDNIMYTRTLYIAHRSTIGGLVIKPSALLSFLTPRSLANVTKTG